MPRPSSESSSPVSGAHLRLPGLIIQGILARSALAFLRIYLGTLFLLAGVPKLRGNFAASLSGFFNHVALENAPPFYREFVTTTIMPNTELFARLIPSAELLVGGTLVLGLGTRLSAAGAVLLLVNYMLAKGAWFWYPSSNDAALIAVAVALMIGAAGRTFGLDALLARRWPRSPLW